MPRPTAMAHAGREPDLGLGRAPATTLVDLPDYRPARWAHPLLSSRVEGFRILVVTRRCGKIGE